MAERCPGPERAGAVRADAPLQLHPRAFRPGGIVRHVSLPDHDFEVLGLHAGWLWVCRGNDHRTFICSPASIPVPWRGPPMSDTSVEKTVNPQYLVCRP